MNNQQIQDIIDILTDALTAEPPTILNLELNKREVHVLLAMCRANIRVPNAVVKVSTEIEVNEVAILLDKIRREIGG